MLKNKINNFIFIFIFILWYDIAANKTLVLKHETASEFKLTKDKFSHSNAINKHKCVGVLHIKSIHYSCNQSDFKFIRSNSLCKANRQLEPPILTLVRDLLLNLTPQRLIAAGFTSLFPVNLYLATHYIVKFDLDIKTTTKIKSYYLPK